MSDRPVLIPLDASDEASSPADVPPIEDTDNAPSGQAMQTLALLAARPKSRLASWFWGTLLALVLSFAGIGLWNFIQSALARSPTLATFVLSILALFLVVTTAVFVKEIAALARLKRMDRFQSEAAELRIDGDLVKARAYAARLVAFYRNTSETNWGASRLNEIAETTLDAETVLDAVEDHLLQPLDAAAMREVEVAARQVATVTALVPLALADVIAALTVNLRMIRRIAQIYGGRSGTLGSWRLTRSVVAHLVATGAVAVGDDLFGSLGGGHLIAKLSRRFGEGLINGALTARVGVSAIEVCRPMPYGENKSPRVSAIVGRAFTGLFEKENL